MGGSGVSGKGGDESPGFFDYILNPVGSIIGPVAGINLTPIASAFSNQVQNALDIVQGNEPQRLWGGTSWLGDLTAPVFGQETQQQQEVTRLTQEDDKAVRQRVRRELDEYGASLLEEDEGD